jgi:hypothetical protein
MPTFIIESAPATDVYARWQEHIEIIKNETIYLFTTRHRFREFTKLFEKNERLHAVGGDLHTWFLGMWGRDSLLAVRREVDGSHKTVNLFQMFQEMRKRPEVLSRARFMAHMDGITEPFRLELQEQAFDDLGITKTASGSPDADHISVATITADCKELTEKTFKAIEYANRMVAHRTPSDGTLEIKVSDIHDAIDAIEPLLQRWYTILKGVSLTGATATIQFHWMQPFEFPWAYWDVK